MIRVAVVEDNHAFRKSLEALISTSAEIELIFSDENSYKLIQIVQIIQPDVVIMDIEMPGINGIESVIRLKEKSPSLNIFMLTVFEDMDNIFESLKAGAVGYLLKKDKPELILDSIIKVKNGESVMNGKIARKVLEYFNRPLRKSSLEGYSLSRREQEILQLLVEGLSYKQIAAQCFITLDTVSTHVKKIYSKLNIHSRPELSAKFGSYFH
ncbi:response regulator transcription factor [Ilyomonas limi]|uniref:Response regulator transcription factor n=1 Tax=Ilyomonas limi TaxID=2575867 RepID=A0A4U3L313_9BACT|nr:response regulator transcription factor [Ilyomonas limi]TKK69310.1 response regulator transcription factor [Ilyomonas limi]